MNSQLVTLFASLALVLTSCTGAPGTGAEAGSPAGAESTLQARRSYSAAARRFVSDLEARLDSREEEALEEEAAQEAHDEERVVRGAVDTTLGVILSLDPAKDRDEIADLGSDLSRMGPIALDTVIRMLDEARPAQQRQALVRALASFKGERAAQALYRHAVGGDAKLSDEARDALARGEALKDRAAREAVRASAAQDARGADAGAGYKRGAVSVLGALGGEDALSEIGSVLRSSGDPEARREAVAALGAIEADGAIPMLYDVLESDPQLRTEAARALGRKGTEETALEFGRILSAPESAPEMRVAAVAGLGADNSRLARDILIAVLRDASHPRAVHQAAVDELARGYADAHAAEVALFARVFESTQAEHLPQMMQPLIARGGDAAVDLLAQRYGVMKPLKKIHAIRSIGRVGGDRAFDTLLSLMQREPDAALAREIVSVVGRFQGERFAEPVLRLLKTVALASEDRQARVEALRRMGEVSPAEAASLASQLIMSEADDSIVIAGIDILRRYGGPDSGRRLLELASMGKSEQVVAKANSAIDEIRARQ
ncbi:MAG: HEAT repeat domain-containing protein [Proteobacteria bacterium]|nr:HEAT repeat domain-containing protein [Pseudomonadota bacterium]